LVLDILFQLCNLNVQQMTREIQDHITSTEAMLNGESTEWAAIRSHVVWFDLWPMATQEEANTGRSVQRLRAEVANNKDLQQYIKKLKVSRLIEVVIFALVCSYG